MDLILAVGLSLCLLVSLARRASIRVKTPFEQAQMREAGRMAAEVLEVVAPHVRAGATTADLDAVARAHIRDVQHAVAAPLHYGGITGGALLSLGEPGKSACKVAAHSMHYLLGSLAFVFDVLGGGESRGGESGRGFFFGLPPCGFPASVCVSVNESGYGVSGSPPSEGY